MSDLAGRHVWIDGAIEPADGRHLSAFDRGFQLGDGVFETLRARAGNPTELEEHLARLQRSATGLDIALPPSVGADLTRGVAELLAADGLDGPDGDASVRITVSRGVVTARGLLPVGASEATIVIQAWPVAPAPAGHLEQGLHLVSSSIRRDPASPLASLKTTSRADYVYARLEARRASADDALFLTIDGRISEGTSANIFLVRRTGSATGSTTGPATAHAPASATELATPSLDSAILPGTTRSWILSWGRAAGLTPVEASLQPSDLAGADEAFLCSSVAGILPVTRFDGAPIGSGLPGPWTGRARAAREAFINRPGGTPK
ncbi:MAG: aminotransferase class IV [Candidatus Limnocylindrales bacterium]